METTPFIVFHQISSIGPCRRVRAGFERAWRRREEPALFYSSNVRWEVLEQPNCRGWVAFLSRGTDWQMANGLPCPTVNYSNRLGGLPTGLNVFADEAEVARVAAEHLLARGYRRFAFVGSPGHGYSAERQRAFGGFLAARGHAVDCLEFPERHTIDPGRLHRERIGVVRAWLARAVPPAGVFCANDDIGRAFLRFVAEIAPERLPLIGVVGVDNLPGDAASESPALSSIEPAYEAIGAVIAARLQGILDGEPFPAGEVCRVAGARLVERASTAAEASDDPLVMRLSARIRQSVQAGAPLRAEELARDFGTSSRSLQVRFSKATGQTMRDFFIAKRLRRAEYLLLNTGHSVAEIAYACGFDKHAALSTQFRRVYGCSPREFRQRARL